MDWFDDTQVEELENFDFIEADLDGLFGEEEEDSQSFNSYLNSMIDC